MTEKPDPHCLEGGFHDYLGDGVYASYDGYHIWLAANDHRNKVVALEPGVFRRLLNYKARLDAEIARSVIKASEG